jgi:mxaC protein
MILGARYPWLLVLLALALLPFFWQKARAISFSSLAIVPRDRVSVVITHIIRAAASLAIASLVLGMAGIVRPERTVVVKGTGAQCVLLFDESGSMDAKFAGALNDETKIDVTRQMALEYVKKRPQDILGIAVFGTSAVFVMPFTQSREALEAAIMVQEAKLHGTSIDNGLFMALSFFEGEPLAGSRCIIFFSDGGSVLRHELRDTLRDLFRRYDVKLYWIFIRYEDEAGPFDAPSEFNLARRIYDSLLELGVPLKAYDATNPGALSQALSDIDKLEKSVIFYQTTASRRLLLYLLPPCTCVPALFDCNQTLGGEEMAKRRMTVLLTLALFLLSTGAVIEGIRLYRYFSLNRAIYNGTIVWAKGELPPEAVFSKAYWLARYGHSNSALSSLESLRYAGRYGFRSEVHYNLGNLYFKEAFKTQKSSLLFLAEESYREALALDPSAYDYKYNLAFLLKLKRKLEQNEEQEKKEKSQTLRRDKLRYTPGFRGDRP